MTDKGFDSSSAVPERIGDILWWLFLDVGRALNTIRVDPHGRDVFDLFARVIPLVGSYFLEDILSKNLDMIFHHRN